MLRFIYKKYIGLVIFIQHLINKFLFKIMAVNFGKNFKTNGLIRINNHGTVTFGDNAIINSSYKFNPIGGNCFTSLYIDVNADLSIGDNFGLSNTAIYCRKKIVIGSNVMIGGDCKIYDTDFHSINLSERYSPNDKGVSKTVIIENGVFIGTGSIILKGSIIGENSIIGAGSVVARHIPPNQVWAGNPIRFIKMIN